MKEFEYRGFPKGRIDPKIARSLWEKGYTDVQIGDAFGVSRDSAAAWRRRNGLKPNAMRPAQKEARLDPAQRIAKIAAEARAHGGMTYGQYTAPPVIVRGHKG